MEGLKPGRHICATAIVRVALGKRGSKRWLADSVCCPEAVGSYVPELPQCRGKNKIECSLKEEVEAGATDQQEVDDRSADIICLHKSAQGAGDQQTAEHENTCVDNGRNESGSKGRRYAVSLTQQTEHKTGQDPARVDLIRQMPAVATGFC